MKIHKIIGFILLALSLILSSGVKAAANNEYDSGQMVPGAMFGSDGSITAVGLISRAAGTVHWAFFDANGNNRESGQFAVTQNQLSPFLWNSAQAGGATLQDVPGYLLFAFDSDGNGLIENGDGNNLTANAFLVKLGVSSGDVAHIPVLDIDDGQLSSGNPANWTNNPITGLDGTDGFDAESDDNDILYMPFLIDGVVGSGERTRIVIFTTGEVAAAQAMTLFDGAGASKAVTVKMVNDHLNVIELEGNPEVTNGFFNKNGFLRWTVPKATDASDVDAFVYIIVESPTFKAIQTLLAIYDD